MGYARSALKSFKYSGYDTLCCSDLSLCVRDFAETSIYMTQKEGLISALVDWAWLMFPSCCTDFMDIHKFYFWIPVCTVWRAEEGSNAFIHLVIAQTSFDTQISFSLMLSSSQSDSHSISASLSNPIWTEQSNVLWVMYVLAWH